MTATAAATKRQASAQHDEPVQSAEQLDIEPKTESAEPAPSLRIAWLKPRDQVDLDRIDEARQRAQQARSAFNTASYNAKRLKKVMEGAYENLDLILSEELGPQEPDLFNQPAVGDQTGPADGDDDTWRDVPLSSLGLADGVIKSLGSAGLSTIGELQAWLEPNDAGFSKKLTDIDGVGRLKAETIERALDQFWAERAKASGPDEVEEIPDDPQD